MTPVGHPRDWLRVTTQRTVRRGPLTCVKSRQGPRRYRSTVLSTLRKRVELTVGRRSHLSPGRRVAFVALAFIIGATRAQGQDIEPRGYSNAPVGVNFLIAGYVYTRGGLSFDSLPITDAHLTTSSAVLAYARVLDLWGKSGKFDVIAALHAGCQERRNTAASPFSAMSTGFNDARVPAVDESLRRARADG